MENEIILQEESIKQIKVSINWAKYAGYLSFVNIGLGLLQLIVGFINQSELTGSAVMKFLISTAISIFLAYHILKFAKDMEIGIRHQNEIALYQSLYHLKMYFLVIGVLMVVVLSIILISIIIPSFAYLVN